MNYSIKEIVENDLCIGCGICVSESTTSEMRTNEYGFLVPKLDDSFNDTAIKVCPFNPSPESIVQDEDALANIFLGKTTNIDFRIGRYENIYVGFSNEYRENSSSGGIATYIFEQLLKRNIVDHLFIVKEVNGNYEYQWFNKIEQIQKISKTRYIPVTLEKLFNEIDAKIGKVAISGVACFIKAVRLKQHYYPHYKEKIPFLVGIICGGVKSSFFTEFLAQKSGIKGLYSKQDYRIKDPNSTALDYSFGAFSNNDEFYKVRMSTVGDMWGSGLFKANACDFCDDVTTELADISLGDAWIPPYSNDGRGTSVIVSRSEIADALVKEGVLLGELTVNELSLKSFKSSQAGGFRHRQNAERFRLSKLKESGSIIPFKRKRMQQSIPIEFKLVQIQRMKIRAASLIEWKNYREILPFEHKINPAQQTLKIFNKIYRIIQKIKSKIYRQTI